MTHQQPLTATEPATVAARVAQRIIGLVEPASVLDLGGDPDLVEALAAGGVAARRISPGDAIGERYDLVTCVDTLEALAADEAQDAIDRICAATDRVLFSSQSGQSQWAAWFAERGFYRRTDADTTFLTQHAVLFERAELSRRMIAERYEGLVTRLEQELGEARAALGASLPAAVRAAQAEAAQRDAEVLARHQELTARDHLIGLEATNSRLLKDLRRARARVQELTELVEEREREIEAVRTSRTWKVGRAVTRPLGKLRR